MGVVIPFLVLWGLTLLQELPPPNPLPAPAPLVPELVNPLAELPVYCTSANTLLFGKGMEIPAAMVTSAIPLSSILSLFGFLDYTVCDPSSGVRPYDGMGGHKLPDDWRVYRA